MRWISKEQILSLHDDILEEFNGKKGIREEALLDSAINAPFQTYGGAELYPGILEKSARLAYGVIRNHPFLDGNKRMGLHLMLIFQELNGIRLLYGEEEMVNLIVAVAAGEITEEKLCMWLKDHGERE